jgi:hypothetical protein
VTDLLGGLVVALIVIALLWLVLADAERSHLSRTSQRITPDQNGGQPWWPWQRQ